MYLVNSILAIYTLRNVFAKFNIDEAVYILTFLLISFGFIKILCRQRIKKWLLSPFIFIFISIAYLIVNIFEYGFLSSFVGYGSIYMYLIAWVFFLSNIDNEKITQSSNTFTKWVISFGIINALLGVYQFFFDPSIFGLVTHRIYGNEDILSAGNVTRRAIGFLGSPQNFSLYMGISWLLVIRGEATFKNKALKSAILLIGGILSGSRAFSLFIISLCCVVFLRIISRYNRINIEKILKYSIVFIIFVIAAASYLVNSSILNDSTVSRLFSFNRWAALEVFIKSFDSFNLFSFLFGKGLMYGTVNIEQSGIILDYSLFESYIISLYHRVGAVQVIVFMYIYIKSLIKTFEAGDFVLLSALLAILVNVCVTPAFAGLQMSFVIWPYILVPLSFNRKLKI